MSRQKIRVRFYREPEGVLAVFPDIIDYKVTGVVNECYARLGQHMQSHRSYHYRLPKATPQEYRRLAAELTSIGYDLIICNESKKISPQKEV